MAPKQVPQERLAALEKIRQAANFVCEGFRPAPGGDAYEYSGSSNHVDDLRDALGRDEYLRFNR